MEWLIVESQLSSLSELSHQDKRDTDTYYKTK